MGWYIVITEEMRALGLTGNDLLVYAALHAYSQKGDGCYYGGQAQLAERCGVAPRTLRDILNRLEEMGLVEEFPVVRHSHSIPAYTTRQAAEIADGQRQNLPAATGRNCRQKENNIVSCINIQREREIDARARGFKVPTLEEVKAYCDERRNNVDAAEFIDHYTSNGWKIGKAPMRDWRAAVRTWERKRTTTPAAPSTAEIMKERRLKYGKNDFLMQNLEALDQLNGTHYVDDYLHGRPLPTDLPALI